MRPDQADAERNSLIQVEQKGQAGGAEKRSVCLCHLFQPLKNKIKGTQGKQPKVFEENHIVSISLEPICLPYHRLTDIQHEGPL
ncbi:MAG: hypothetical protein K0R67_2139 [Paenibacillus sp.]|nr:hypothetical protein [Paenibacillus sp.]